MNTQKLDKFIRNNFLFLCIILAVIFAVAKGATIFQIEPPHTDPAKTTIPTAQDATFRTYWYNGQAEINTYTLDKVRYGQLNQGEAVLVFVTEDFRTDTQVKLESNQKNLATSVLKLNFIQKFTTGIYDYSLMNSTFTPVDTQLFPHALKTSFSAQEWCGHVYSQLNLKGKQYWLEGKSYFEKEVQQDTSLKVTWLEDELWNRIRLSPASLPVDDFDIIPSLESSRLQHRPLAPTACRGTLQVYTGTVFVGNALQAYSVAFLNQNRVLTIVFENVFPYKIVGWTDVFSQKGKTFTTQAILKKTLKIDYWNKNKPENTSLRDSLLLQTPIQP
ncbi:hypothetical protein [Flectobacillus major]|uniref:hypothetical protein n=1 Tax=Flectobacillus major TaxID=103 RepID=UPI00040D8D0E|nr:hypothetical protein [Flectobacillus major]